MFTKVIAFRSTLQTAGRPSFGGRGSSFIRLKATSSLYRALGKLPINFHVRILVVDDTPDVAETLGDLLRELGHDVHLAYSGAAALLLAPDLRPEVVFCDLAMPHLDGLVVGECLRQSPELRGSTLVAWTGFADPHYQDLARRSGFDAYLVKPGPIEEFLSRLPTAACTAG